MKIISGHYKNRNFYMPFGIRPTQDLVRKSLFDTLGQDLTGLTFLDLFAGSGSMGLEALSRGAKEAVFVESDEKAYDTIQENITHFNVAQELKGSSCDVLNIDAFASIKQMSRQGKKFDIIYADPPYGRELAKKTLKTLDGYDIFKPNCVVIIQHEKREILPAPEGRIVLFREKSFGNTLVSIYNVK